MNPPSFMSPGDDAKQRAFALARCRKAALLLGGAPDDVAQAALRAPDVQRELRSVLGDSFGGDVDLRSVRDGTWRLAPGSPLQRHITGRMRAHLAATAQRREDEAARRGNDTDAGRALEAALAAQEAATHAAEGTQREAAAAARGRRAQLAGAIADAQAELRELDELHAPRQNAAAAEEARERGYHSDGDAAGAPRQRGPIWRQMWRRRLGACAGRG